MVMGDTSGDASGAIPALCKLILQGLGCVTFWACWAPEGPHWGGRLITGAHRSEDGKPSQQPMAKAPVNETPSLCAGGDLRSLLSPTPALSLGLVQSPHDRLVTMHTETCRRKCSARLAQRQQAWD